MQRLGAADRTIWYVDSRRRGLNRPPLRLINDLFYLLHRSHEKVSDAFKVCQAFAQNISFSTVYTVVDVDGCVIITKKPQFTLTISTYSTQKVYLQSQ